MQAIGSVIYFPKQSKPTPKPKTSKPTPKPKKKPGQKWTVLEWIRNGYQFPGKGAPMTYGRKTKCAIARCPYCSWSGLAFGVDSRELGQRAIEETITHLRGHEGMSPRLLKVGSVKVRPCPKPGKKQ